jgi:hypothetical protein
MVLHRVGLAGMGLLVAVSVAVVGAAQRGAAVRIDADDIGGAVTGPKGPEAGVWVIAETTDLPTKFAKIVVTDDRGRYVLPDLPGATYSVWVRGYGLVDSPKKQAQPGKRLDLTAVAAPDARTAAEYYPANYWYALMQPPPKSDFPGTGPEGNGLPAIHRTQAHWIGDAKMTFSCTQCHQMGNKATRELPPPLRGKFASSVEAWKYRTNVGQSSGSMYGRVRGLGEDRALKIFADWSDRIAAGELPEVPPRPQGIERNVVLTLWDWATEKTFVHDEISTDKRNPTLNANGPIYSVQELSGDFFAVLDPNTHTASRVEVPPHDPSVQFAWPQTMPNPSPYWGEEPIWAPKVVLHNPMMDAKGRVWSTARGGCRVLDPKTKSIAIAKGCEMAHHLQFGYDKDQTLWSNSPVSYFKTRLWDEQGDAVKAGSRVPLIMDTNGNGKQDPAVGPTDPLDPAKDRRIQTAFLYAVIPSPVDGSVWFAEMATPGSVLRMVPGAEPETTALTERYEPPFQNPKSKVSASLPHGIDIDRNGVVWVSLTGSGHLASFDRRKCTAPLSGPQAVGGQHCPEGWTLYQAPGPNFKGVTDPGSADSFYYNWVDQFGTFGLGENVPLLNGSGSDSIMALVNGRWVTMRVPYPMGFHSRGMDGRIDNTKTGWKGRGLWATYGTSATWHIEGGKGTRPKLVRFQLRPDPLQK